MQVAQEAAIKDLIGQLGGVQEKLAEDPQLQDLMMRMMDRVQEDLGGPDELARLFSRLGFPVPPGGPGVPGELPGFGGTAPTNPAQDSYDDRPRPKPDSPDKPTPPVDEGDDAPPAGA